MAPVPTTLWPSPYLRQNFPEERSAFVFALGHNDRSVGGTACSSGPTCIRISHLVLRLCAHARIGGCARLEYRKTRPGGDALKEMSASDTPSQVVVHGPTPQPFVATQPCAGLLAPLLSPRTSLDSSTIHGLVNRPPTAVRKGTHPKRRGRAANHRFVALTFQSPNPTIHVACSLNKPNQSNPMN